MRTLKTMPGEHVRAIRVLLVLLLAAPLLRGVPAQAQEPAPLRIGQTVTGTLTANDPVMSGNGPFRVYRLEARQGQRLIATLRSGAFDALLLVMRPIAGVHETVGSDDDSGGGTDARMRWVAPVTGTYHIVAQALGADERGGYSLVVEEAPPARPATPQPIAAGESRRGTLDRNSPLIYDGDAESFYQLYTFDARAGEQLIITLESSDFDAFLQFGALQGDTLQVTHADDDGGGETNARLRVTIPADGRYGIHARGLSAEAAGAFVLSLRAPRAAAPRPVAAGRDITGSLGSDDSDAENRYFNDWVYRGAAGERLRIRMSSGEFDTLLLVGTLVNGELQELAKNDDESDASTDSLLEVTLPAAGEYIIRAASFDAGTTGAYTLRIDPVR